MYVNGPEEKDRNFLTKNETEVDKILAWKKDFIYYISTWPGKSNLYTDNALSSGKFGRQGFFHYWELFHYWERSELDT